MKNVCRAGFSTQKVLSLISGIYPTSMKDDEMKKNQFQFFSLPKHLRKSYRNLELKFQEALDFKQNFNVNNSLKNTGKHDTLIIEKKHDLVLSVRT